MWAVRGEGGLNRGTTEAGEGLGIGHSRTNRPISWKIFDPTGSRDLRVKK